VSVTIFLFYCNVFISHADGCRVARVHHGLYVFFQTMSQNPIQLGSPNLTHKCSTMSPGNAFIFVSKGQRSRSQRPVGLQTERNITAVAYV